MAQKRHEWKYLPKDRHGLKPSTFHNWHGFIYPPESVDRGQAVKSGWIQTKARNRYLMFKNRLGRLEWHETNRCRVIVKKPVSQGKAYQLLADGFFSSGLIFDVRVFEGFIKSLRFKGASAVFPTGGRLPYMKIDFLKLSNGVTVTLGDRSHPDSVEINFNYPDWGERMERFLESLARKEGPSDRKPGPVDDSYIR